MASVEIVARGMRIGIDARFWGTDTGIGRYIGELVEAMLDRCNHEFVLFLRKKNWDKAPKHHRVQKVLAEARWYTLREQLKLPAVFDRAGCDLLHFPHWNVPVGVRTPYVLTVHDLLLLHFPGRRASFLGPVRYAIKYAGFKFVLRQALRRAKAIIVPSNFTAGRVRELFSVGEKIQVVYEGVSALPVGPGFEALKTKGISKPYFLYVGNAYPHKNLAALIEAVSRLQKNGHEATLVLTGVQDDFYKRLRDEYGNMPNIVFYGRATDGELDTLYSEALAYVSPSLEEGFGLPGLEAMAHSIPVVSSSGGSLPEIYGDAALYFDPQDQEGLESVLEIALKDAELRNSLIRKGKTIIEKFTWERAAMETLKIYESVWRSNKGS